MEEKKKRKKKVFKSFITPQKKMHAEWLLEDL